MELPELLRHVAATLERLGIEYAVVGSFASTAWGEPRLTLDVDIVVRLDERQIDSLLAAFPDDEYYASRAAAEEGVRFGRPFNIIHFPSGNKVDFIPIGATPWANAQIDRRRKLELSPGAYCYVAAPEDVIIGKLIYFGEGGSQKHLRDIVGILKHCGVEVDRDYIARWSEAMGATKIWRDIRNALSDE